MAKAANGSARFMLLALLVVALVLVWLVIRPFAAALFMALVMAVTFYPWRNRLAARLGTHTLEQRPEPPPFPRLRHGRLDELRLAAVAMR